MATRDPSIFKGPSAYGRHGSENMLDLAQAGPRQYAANIDNLAGNSPFVRRNVIPILIEAPRFFQFMDDPNTMVSALKQLIEVHTRTVTGLNRTLRVTSGEVPTGGSGEVWQTPTNVTRERSNPVHTAPEIQGRSITNFIGTWINWGIADENTKVPLVVTQKNVQAKDYDATFYGMTVLYIEPDPTHTTVVNAILCTNMYPTEQPSYESSMDLAGFGGDTEEVSIPFTATSDVSVGVRLLAQKILNDLDVRGLNPNDTQILLQDISADVKASEVGQKKQLDDGVNSTVTYR